MLFATEGSHDPDRASPYEMFAGRVQGVRSRMPTTHDGHFTSFLI